MRVIKVENNLLSKAFGSMEDSTRSPRKQQYIQWMCMGGKPTQDSYTWRTVRRGSSLTRPKKCQVVPIKRKGDNWVYKRIVSIHVPFTHVIPCHVKTTVHELSALSCFGGTRGRTRPIASAPTETVEPIRWNPAAVHRRPRTIRSGGVTQS